VREAVRKDLSATGEVGGGSGWWLVAGASMGPCGAHHALEHI